ncbi:MAG: cyclic nucleotide-binding domain-containing protein, partial [archaeon]|nr:cyclic nucleotide-binding domain-containing protein [archaeon]
MGNNCYHNIQINDTSQVTNSPNRSALRSPRYSDRRQNSSRMSHRRSYISRNISRNSVKRNSCLGKILLPEDYEKSVLKFIKEQNTESEDKDLISGIFQKHFFMKALDEQTRNKIIQEMSLVSIKKGIHVYRAEGYGEFFYIIKKGSVQISGNPSRVLETGMSFGELALLHETPRGENVITMSDCLFWVLNRKNFREVVNHITYLNFDECKSFIEKIPILNAMDSNQRNILCSNLFKESFEKGQFIVHKGEIGNCLYIVKEGEVSCVLDGKIIRTLKKGDNFGERSILVDSPRSLDVIAATNCICYSVSSTTLKTMLGVNFRTQLYLKFIQSSFSKSKFLNNFDTQLLDNAIDIFKSCNLSSEEIALTKGCSKSEKLIIVIDGSLIHSKTKEIICQRGDILFEKELLEESEAKIYYNIIAYPDCLLMKAEMTDVIQLIGGSLKDIINKA